MKKIKKSIHSEKFKKNLDINIPKLVKKSVEVKKSYIVTNGLDYYGKNYKKGDIIKLSTKELIKFPINSIR